MAGGYALVAFFGLTTIHVSAAILYKYSQSGGKYEYSPATTLVLAEVFKFFMSAFMHCGSVWTVDPRQSVFSRLFFGAKHAYCDAKKQLNARIVGQLCGLACSYAVYNQLQFLVFMWADAASVVLLRSSGSFIAALMAFFLLHRLIVRLQWLNILLQVCGLIIVQYDSCRAQASLPIVMYVLLFLHVSLSSFNSIWNEHLVKAKNAPSLNVQNAVLYAFGTLFNFIAYLSLPNSLYGISAVVPVAKTGVTIGKAASLSSGFFHGYTFLTILIVILNSVIGIAITAVYKYADVIIKTFSLACATGTLFIVDWIFFNRSINVNVFLGIVVVYGASYLYFSSTRFSQIGTSAPSSPTQTSHRQGDNETDKGAPISPRGGARDPSGFFSYCLIFVPEFLLQKKPSKVVSLGMIVTLVLLTGFIVTHSGDLGKKPAAPNSPHSPAIVPEGALSPGHFFRGPVTMPVPITPPPIAPPEPWNPAVAFKERKYEPNNRIDSLATNLGVSRQFHKETALELAVCFIESPPTANVRMARWEVELDLFSSSRYDKILVHDLNTKLSYAPFIRPIATLNHTLPRYSNYSAVTGPETYCHLSDWLRTVQFAKSCLEALDYHHMAFYTTYRWLWIVEPHVTWRNSLPDSSTLQPDAIHLRSGVQDLSTDISSIFGSVEKVTAFVKALDTATRKQVIESGSGLTTPAPDLAFVVKTAAESSSTTIQQTSWMPSRGTGEPCIDSFEATTAMNAFATTETPSRTERGWAIELGEYLG